VSVLGVLGMLGLLGELLRAAIALLVVGALAVLALRVVSRRGWLSAPSADAGPGLRVLRRLALEPRQHLYLVEVGPRVLLIGVGDGAAPRMLLDLGVEDAAAAAPTSAKRTAPETEPGRD